MNEFRLRPITQDNCKCLSEAYYKYKPQIQSVNDCYCNLYSYNTYIPRITPLPNTSITYTNIKGCCQ